jgi:hypothetical protein
MLTKCRAGILAQRNGAGKQVSGKPLTQPQPFVVRLWNGRFSKLGR